MRTPIDVSLRFWDKVRIGDGCWLWTGCRREPYGAVWIGGRSGGLQGAHRVAYTLLRGPIPDGLQVLHDCPDGDNPLCVRPSHLFLGTQADNVADCLAKGRFAIGDRNGSRQHRERLPRGEAHPAARLSVEQVSSIRERWNAGESVTSIASAMSVSRRTIRRVGTGAGWRHVED